MPNLVKVDYKQTIESKSTNKHGHERDVAKGL
jgi:hypothetical protein